MHLAWNKVRRFLVAEEGPTAVEYAVMLGMIVLACLTAITLVGQSTADSFNSSATSMSDYMSP